jgi:hypothetical protein
MIGKAVPHCNSTNSTGWRGLDDADGCHSSINIHTRQLYPPGDTATIAVTAPQKFDYQDLACVEMMLRFRGVCGTQFLVEPTGGRFRIRSSTPSLSSFW